MEKLSLNDVEKFEVIKDLVDQFIDLMLNYRQSGHPGGSRSKVHMLLSSLLSGYVRFDLRDPAKPFNDRIVLAAGHTIPLVYATLAVFNEAMRLRYEETKDKRYLPKNVDATLYPKDLLTFRRRGGLPGHAEMGGKTLILKFNTGPSGHGITATVGEAFALKRMGLNDVKVVVYEGDAGLTPGGAHETMNSAWALGLDNLFFLIDWNNFGIDDHPLSETVPNTPKEWFGSHNWRVVGTMKGNEFPDVFEVVNSLFTQIEKNIPNVAYFKTRKGRDYLKYDNKSHGAPHPMNSEIFWQTKSPFQEKYGVKFEGFMEPPPATYEERMKQFEKNIDVVVSVLRNNKDVMRFLADRLLQIAESVPDEIQNIKIDRDKNPLHDETLYDYKNYPPEIYAKPGEKQPNRAAFRKWGAWINAYTTKKYGRPLFLALSADLTESTNIDGFGLPFGDFPGLGWYDREKNRDGVLLPQEITEFVNSGICVGVETVNIAKDPYKDFVGFYTACSTYGSFAYLKYGMMRLFSQLAQDCPIKVGKVIWVAGHSGPETADDSRTHFGIFATGVTKLFPKGQVICLYPWEYNEVPVLLARALKEDTPIIVLNLTRPPIEIPDRESLGLASHFEAVHGAYILKDYENGIEKMGTVIVQGTSPVSEIIKIIPKLKEEKLNVKIVVATSYELFMRESEEYKNRVLPKEDWANSMVITNECLKNMSDWIFSKVNEEYSMSSDWDNRWRTGGTVEDVLEEAHLTKEYILEGIKKFISEKEKRLKKIKDYFSI
jgi:transketolase